MSETPNAAAMRTVVERCRDYFADLLTLINPEDENRLLKECDAALSAPPEQPPNAAVMRDALFWVKDRLLACDIMGKPVTAVKEMLSVVNAALEEPTRNCDRFSDAESARQAWLDDKDNWDAFGDPKLDLHEWLFAPAEGKEESK